MTDEERKRKALKRAANEKAANEELRQTAHDIVEHGLKPGNHLASDLQPKVSRVYWVGGYASFSGKGKGAEYNQLETLVSLITAYVKIDEPDRPLSIAIFGAPGSGKSATVKDVAKTVHDRLIAEKSQESRLADLEPFNLTQIASPTLLAGHIEAATARAVAKESVPFVFFDEFDGPLNGRPWGWLSWFLSPMQDGEFISDGGGILRKVMLKKAVFVFAGGTASTFDTFKNHTDRDRVVFALAKGPDFVSRLRGFANLEGINTEKNKLLRRAIAIHWNICNWNEKHFNIDRVADSDEADKARATLADAVRNQMLYAGRYRHGRRSVEAIFDMIVPNNDKPRKRKKSLTLEDVPSHLLRMHADMGPLDRKAIGGWITLGGSDADQFRTLWDELERQLWDSGATIAFAGTGREEHTILRSLAERAERWSVRLTSDKAADQDTQPDVPDNDTLIVFHHAKLKRVRMTEIEKMTNKGEKLSEGISKRIKIVKTSLADVDVKDNEIHDSIAMFRLRHSIAQGGVAHIFIGGNLRRAVSGYSEGFLGRFPSFEGTMIALAMGHPVYIVGIPGSSTEWCGRLLGLSESLKAYKPLHFGEGPRVASFDKYFSTPRFPALPLNREQMTEFFIKYRLGGDLWPNNGLTEDENRSLFAARKRETICRLIMKGLANRFDPTHSPAESMRP
jgi:hypothetical protein